MDIFALVDEIRFVLDGLRRQHGEFVLAMLYNKGGMGTAYGWNLIVAAPWTDEMGRTKAISTVVRALEERLGPTRRAGISRVTVLKTSDPFVREMVFLYPAAVPAGPGVPVAHVAAGDVNEGSGYVFYSQRAEVVRR